MTDNEIIKALELCFADDFENCEECPLKDKRDGIFSCMRTKQELTLDLINRQKAEIERLGDCNRRLKDDMRMMLNNDNGSEQIKSEAIKEFAERLKDEFVKGIRVYNGYASVKDVLRNINNLVKEMVGGE